MPIAYPLLNLRLNHDRAVRYFRIIHHPIRLDSDTKASSFASISPTKPITHSITCRPLPYCYALLPNTLSHIRQSPRIRPHKPITSTRTSHFPILSASPSSSTKILMQTVVPQLGVLTIYRLLSRILSFLPSISTTPNYPIIPAHPPHHLD
jgi:hypothetical protein